MFRYHRTGEQEHLKLRVTFSSEKTHVEKIYPSRLQM